MKKTIFLSTLVALSFVSCKKTDDIINNPVTNNTASSPTPTFQSGDGFIIAINTATTTNAAGVPMTINMGTAVAGMGDLANSKYVDMGTVSLNGKDLSKQSNNTYTFMPGTSNPTGIDLSGDINWSVSNPSFTYNANNPGKGMPKGGAWSNASTDISGGSDLNINLTSAITNADSVYFVLIDSDGKQLIQRKAGNAASDGMFSSADVSSMKKGAGYVQIVPWNVETKTLGGKQIHVINELVQSYGINFK